MYTELKPSRVETLCDGIFAIAMTLLVVSFNDLARWPAIMNEAQVRKEILDLLPDFAYYVQSFIILGAFWVEHHHQFQYIKHVDLTLLFINIFAFMFVALIPFSTMVVGDYGHTRIAAMLFEINLLISGALFCVHWIYAAKKPGIANERLDSKTVNFYIRKNLVVPIISAIAIGISIINPQVGSSMYFVVPIIIFLQRDK